MPLIEELPVTSTIKASHGWAYVPDTGPIAAQQPGSRDRKRVAAATSRHAATASAKHQKGIQLRLDSLNKENYKDGVSVPIPTRSATSAREKAGRKMTGNVRRILTYQRGFAHYLADEEANNPGGRHYLLPNLPGGMGPPAVSGSVAVVAAATTDGKGQKGAVTGKEEGRRKSGVSRTRSATNETSAGPATPTLGSQSRGKKRGLTGSRAKSSVDEQNLSTPTPTPAEQHPLVKPEDIDHPMTDADADANPDTDAALPAQSPTHPPPSPSTNPYPLHWDTDPLLLTTPSEVPSLPSTKIMSLLLSEPPLTYNAVRATPLEPDQQRPPRHFCGVCGYWGRVRCRKCDEWTCGIMECWKGHEGVCVVGVGYG